MIANAVDFPNDPIHQAGARARARKSALMSFSFSGEITPLVAYAIIGLILEIVRRRRRDRLREVP